MSENSEAKKPKGLNAWLDKSAAAATTAAGAGKGGVGQPLEVDLDLLDPNPEQPRREMNDDELEELANSIQSNGLIQPISVTRKPDGRYIIISGHRRSAAFRHLRDNSKEGGAKWARVPANDRGATAQEELAVLAITENLQRVDLTPVDTAEALAKLQSTKGWTGEELARQLGLEYTKTKRFLQLGDAPAELRKAIGSGLMVPTGETKADGSPKREHRQLEFSLAISVLRAHKHWTKTKPKKAIDLTKALVEKVLTEGWTRRRLDDHVDSLLDKPQPADGEGANAGPSTPSKSASSLYQTDAKRLVISRTQIASATPTERAELKQVLLELLGQLD